MQGTLNEIDIRSILQLIELGQRTGELLLEACPYPANGSKGDTNIFKAEIDYPDSDRIPSHPGPFWLVFFINGQIAYAADSNGSLWRLRDYLRRYGVESALDQLQVPSIASIHTPEYGYLWALMEKHLLTPAQGRSILQSMIKETLFDLLSLHQGFFRFEMNSALAPQLTTLEITPLLTKIMKQVQEWKQFHPYIQSPNQCPVITNPEELSVSLPIKAFTTLNTCADGKTSLRQLSRYLNRDILTVAGAIYPYLQQGWVQLVMGHDQKISHQNHPSQARQTSTITQIVCIEDDVAIGKAVEYILQQHGYQVTVIRHPVKALSLAFELQPKLILCDIAMPELDGYEICAMLRQSTAFRHTPLIMLTGMDGFIDRVRATMVGATDYLTKPFGESELLMLVEKYLGSKKRSKLKPTNLFPDLEQTIKDPDVRAG
jgi:twitching motility two-component system response regulator PilG